MGGPDRPDEIIVIPIEAVPATVAQAHEDVIAGGRPRRGGWGLVALPAAAVAVVAALHGGPAGRAPAPVVAAPGSPQPSVAPSVRPDGNYVYAGAGHCPVGVACAFDDSLAAAGVQLAHRLFVGSRGLSTNAWYDSRTGNVFDQNIALVTGNNVGVALSIHRESVRAGDPSAVVVGADPDLPDGSGRSMTLVVRRGGWVLTARLIGARSTALLPVTEATSWLLSVPTPGWTVPPS